MSCVIISSLNTSEGALMLYLRKKADVIIYYSYLLVYTVVNMITLKSFPFVHSDEIWLAGLSREYMISQSIYVTEPFFNLLPRYPHAIKCIFHGFQMVFITLFSYNIFSVRLISLFFGIATLVVLHKILLKIFKDTKLPLLITLLFSINIQFLYASHFARQEIVLLFMMLLALYTYRYSNFSITYKSILTGLILGVSIGIHPNSFLIALAIGLIILFDVLTKKISYKSLIITVTITGCFAIIFSLISYLGDHDFINHYINYGSTLSVDASLIEKIRTFDDFYIKLFLQIGGTYYLPNIRIFLTLTVILLISSIIYMIYKKKRPKVLVDSILALIAINCGIIIIGRYNATSILFITPFIYLLFAWYLGRLPITYKWLSLIVILIISVNLYYTYNEVNQYNQSDYDDYIDNIQVSLPDNAVILGNLSAGFAYENSIFYDIRNLAYLEKNNMTIEEYIKIYNINTIVYYEEQDYINRNPKWQILYNEDDFYYDDLQVFLENNCTLVSSFHDPIYGIRIVRYMHDYPWEVRIYHVNK